MRKRIGVHMWDDRCAAVADVCYEFIAKTDRIHLL